MSDLFDRMEEHKAERMAIMHESKVPDAGAAAEEDRHRCEIKWVIREFFPDGKRAADYFSEVEKKRGEGPAKRLRDDCRDAWAKHRAEMAGQS